MADFDAFPMSENIDDRRSESSEGPKSASDMLAENWSSFKQQASNTLTDMKGRLFPTRAQGDFDKSIDDFIAHMHDEKAKDPEAWAARNQAAKDYAAKFTRDE